MRGQIKSVCRVFLQRAVGSEVSTGFHWGNGWVGTNAHAILGTPHNRNRQWTNPNVDTAMITIEFPNIELSSGKPLRFEGHYRFAVIGDLPDSNGDDVAFIKIGHQVRRLHLATTNFAFTRLSIANKRGPSGRRMKSDVFISSRHCPT